MQDNNRKEDGKWIREDMTGEVSRERFSKQLHSIIHPPPKASAEEQKNPKVKELLLLIIAYIAYNVSD